MENTEEKKPIRIFNYPWHLSHQYSLFQIPNTKWTWLHQHRRQYGEGPRGKLIEKFGVNFVPYYESGKYDVALLHLDQQCMEKGIWEIGKGSLFRDVDKVIGDIPKIVIMHGTPYYPEQFECDIHKCSLCKNAFAKSIINIEPRPTTNELICPQCEKKSVEYNPEEFTLDQVGMSSELIRRFKKIAESLDYVIFNSKTAAKQWGFTDLKKGRAIWHGLDASEWRDLPKEPRVVTMISPGGLDMYYDRVFLQAVKDELTLRDIYHCHITVDVNFKNFDEYREFLGRSLVYFNPTAQSPMPRSRTEAMLSGCCVVSTINQDADEFIKDGENGFRALRNVQYVVDIIEALIKNYKLAVKVGQEGKKTAIELFSKERYEKEWSEVLDFVISNYKK